MAWSQADLDAIDLAIGAGVKRVSYTDRTIEYQTLEEMLKARAAMQTEIAGETGVSGSRTSYAEFSRE